MSHISRGPIQLNSKQFLATVYMIYTTTIVKCVYPDVPGRCAIGRSYIFQYSAVISLRRSFCWKFVLDLQGFLQMFFCIPKVLFHFCGWLGRQQLHALVFLFLFDILCVLDCSRVL